MNERMINSISDAYAEVCEAIAKAIRDDHSLSEWPCHLIYSGDDIQSLSCSSGKVTGHAKVWTNTTGGSNEYPNFTIPLDTLNKYL